MGDNAAAGLLDKAGACGGPVSGTENDPIVLDPEPLVVYAVVLPFEYPEGDDDDGDSPLIRFPCS